METTTEDHKVDALQAFFEKAPLPNQVALYPGTMIVDLPLFVQTQLLILRSADNPLSQKLALDRLLRLKVVLERK